jgi:hypothetical protein
VAASAQKANDAIAAQNKANRANADAMRTEQREATKLATILDKLNPKAAKTNDLNAQIKTAQQRLNDVTTGNKPLTPSEIASGITAQTLRQAIAAGQAQIADVNKPAQVKRGPTDESERAIAQAQQEELKARLDLTHDVELQAQLQHDQVQAETQEKLSRLAEQVARGNVSKSAAEIAAASYEQAAAEKDILIERQKTDELAKRELDQRSTVGGYLDRQAQAQEDLAKNATDRATIEKASLDRRQQLERDQVDTENAEKVRDGKLTAAQASEQKAALAAAQDAEQRAQAEKSRVAIINETAQNAQDELQLQQDVLQAKRDAAPTATQQAIMDAELLDIANQKERIEAQRLVDSTLAGTYEHKIAVERLNELEEIQNNRGAASLGKATDIFETVANQFTGISDAVKQHDWAKVFTSLDNAVAEFVKVFKTQGATLADKIGGIAGVVSGIGNLVGGKVGGFLSGAGSGAATGAQLGSIIPGIGTAIGAVAGGIIGGITSLFGGNSQKRQERRDAQNQAAEAAAQAAQQAANEKRDLELKLIEASGDKMALLNAQRQDEISKVSEADQALQKEVYDAQDRLERSNEVRDVESELMDLTGNKLGALTIQRQEELKSIDASIQPLYGLMYAAEDATDALTQAKTNLQNAFDAEIARQQDLINGMQDELNDLQGKLSDAQDAVSKAHDDLANAYDVEAGKIQDVIDKTNDFIGSLTDYRNSLNAPSASLSPENAYNAAKAQFNDVNAKAMGGDATAQGQFTQVAEQFRQASQSYFGISSQYNNDLNAIKAATDAQLAQAKHQVDVQQSQLDALNKLVSGYLDVNKNTVSIDQGIKNLVSAQGMQNSIQQQIAAKQAQLLTAQQQLQNTQAMVNAILGVGQGVMSLGDAIAQYQQAQAAQANAIQALANAVQAAKANPNNQPISPPATTGPSYRSTNGDYAAYVEQNPDLKALFQANAGMAKGRTEAEFGVYHWANFGQYENRNVRPYARGGDFSVGGMGGTDSQMVQFKASPDESVAIRTPEQIEREAANENRRTEALEKMNEKLDALIMEAKASVRQTGDHSRKTLAKLDGLGQSFGTYKRRAGKKPNQ